MRNRALWLGVLLPMALSVLMPRTWLRAEQPQAANPALAEAVFDLREKPVFPSDPESRWQELARGARATCQEQPHAEVKAYPQLRTQKPIYGLVRLAPEVHQPESGTPLYFVIDESGASPVVAPQEEETPGDEPSLLQKLSSAIFGSDHVQSADEPARLNNTYDRLHVDLNGDLDLTNDAVVAPLKTPPAGAIRTYSNLRQAVVFEEIAVPLDFGPDAGTRPVRLVPRLEVQEYEGQAYPGVEFISAVVRAGDIKIGPRAYHAILAQQYLITGRYDRPFTQLLLKSTDNAGSAEDEYWWGANQLNAMHLINGQYYTTTTTPLGDKLTVAPYQGDFGILKIGPGDRKLTQFSIQGSLQSRSTALAVGAPGNESAGGLLPVAECRLPVGDYMPNYVTLQYGHLQLSISENYHSDGKPRNIDRNAWSYGIKIRKDEPFVWDFSTPPEVLFASPAKAQTYKRGDEVNVLAVLTDPQLTIMIRGLVDTRRKEKKTYDGGDGRTGSYETNVSLDPQVTITNAAGKQVAEGPLPFG